ncbi:DUF202 domain-containing protein [candidate division WOR-3 bacterium]|uniref:DUF202 domain-containing protein n=1 Tax=candidate division WOR-3 bacterium TaxID=2052148 RepID=A0A9D5QD08_UNCW3|nr:DUF202 domain-containing protein [candidate division WOR-3 bacterium]MBD3365129.1 DUF202 domain-containing protein [candidate division WOR-3 bacterium]
MELGILPHRPQGEGLKAKESNERILLARQRNLLAAERTFSAWIRTGIAALAAGLGIAELLSKTGPLTGWLGLIFTAAGAGVFLLALWSYYRTWRILENHSQERIRMTPLWLLTLLVLVLSGTAVLVFIVVSG